MINVAVWCLGSRWEKFYWLLVCKDIILWDLQKLATLRLNWIRNLWSSKFQVNIFKRGNLNSKNYILCLPQRHEINVIHHHILSSHISFSLSCIEWGNLKCKNVRKKVNPWSMLWLLFCRTSVSRRKWHKSPSICSSKDVAQVV